MAILSIVGIAYAFIAIVVMIGVIWFFWSLNKPISTMFGKAEDYTTTDCAGFEVFATIVLGLAWPTLFLFLVVSKLDSLRMQWHFKKKMKKLDEFRDDEDILF